MGRRSFCAAWGSLTRECGESFDMGASFHFADKVRAEDGSLCPRQPQLLESTLGIAVKAHSFVHLNQSRHLINGGIRIGIQPVFGDGHAVSGPGHRQPIAIGAGKSQCVGGSVGGEHHCGVYGDCYQPRLGRKSDGTALFTVSGVGGAIDLAVAL